MIPNASGSIKDVGQNLIFYLMLCNYKPCLLCMAMQTKDSISYGSATYRCGEDVMGAAVKEVCFADLGVIIRGPRLLSCKWNNYEYSEEWFRVLLLVNVCNFDNLLSQ